MAEETPKTAIDWLKIPPPAPEANAVGAGEAGSVETVSIGVAALDSAGTLSAAESGVTLEFWRGLSALRARTLLTRVRGSGAPSAAALYRRILLSRARPPLGAGRGGGFLRLRVERLLQIGALADARALLKAAGARGPAFAEYTLTIGQLMAEDLAPCAAASADPRITLALESQIYCQIRLGDHTAARASLDRAHGLGRSEPAILDLLEAQISPELAQTVMGPTDVAALSPLALALIDGIGAPRPANFAGAPAAYAWADLTEAAPPRDQLLAAEKLARVGAILANRLIALYARQRSAESGGVWGRVAAWRKMGAADTGDLAEAVAVMDQMAAKAGLRAALAPTLHEYASRSNPSPTTTEQFAEIALLAGDPAAAITRLTARAPNHLRALATLLTGGERTFPDLAANARRGDPAAQRLTAALAALAPSPTGPLSETPEARRLAAMTNETPAAAILEALALLDAGEEIAPAPLYAALAALAATGFARDARAIAVETLLAGRTR